jgi:hypothetical protein
MDKKILPAIAGTSAAIAITTTLDATGYTVFSALPLFPLTALFWYLQKFSRAEIGLAWGPPYAYGLALAYPAIVLSLIGLIAFLAGAVDTSQADWNKTFLNMALMSSTGVILVAISLDTGFDVPANEIPIYLVNATFLGLVWGLLRQVSGSVVVPAVCHSVWNGIDYPLYGFGEKVGALGIEQTHIYGPEVGIIVVAINAVVVGALFYKLSWNRK